MSTRPEDTPPSVAPGGDMPDAESAGDALAAGAAAEPPELTDIEDRPLREMTRIALPVVVAMTSYTLMQMVDKLMVSRIGPDPIYVGAQGNGGLSAFVPLSMVMGCLTVINTYVAQNLGNKTPRRAPAYAWAGLWLGLCVWVVLLPYAYFMPYIFEWMGHESHRVALEAGHGRILVVGAVFTISARAFSQFFYGIHRPWVVLASEVSANITNFCINSVVIYGPEAPEKSGTALFDGWYSFTASVAHALGIPRLGVPGAAIGTVVGTMVELIIPMLVFLSPAFNRLYATRASWRPSLKPIKDILRIGWPGGLMFGNEMICWAFFMVYLVGRFGEYHSTAGWIAHQWMSLSFMPSVGISVAITAVVGRCIGARRHDLAARRAWLGLGVSATYMGTMGLLFVLLRHQMVGMFIDGGTPAGEREQIMEIGARFMIACATFQLFDGVAMSMSGALRGAGDTVWIGVATVVLAWSVIVGGGLTMVNAFPQLGSLGPWISSSAYIVLLSLMALGRFLTGKWKSITLIERGDPPPGH